MKGIVREYNYNSSIICALFLVLWIVFFSFIYAFCYIFHVLSNEELLAIWYVHFPCQLSGLWDIYFRIKRFFFYSKKVDA